MSDDMEPHHRFAIAKSGAWVSEINPSSTHAQPFSSPGSALFFPPHCMQFEGRKLPELRSPDLAHKFISGK